MDDRRARIEELFHAALERDADERETYLTEACGDDTELRREVESLLVHQGELGSFLGSPIEVEGARVEVGAALGDYSLIRRLGEGGMGEVWLARQEQPLRREVAIKIIKPGMDSRQIVSRFEVERLALARMEHPNIARVFDAGTTPEGRPFFAMEYVDGVPITRYCDDRRLTTRERLELFQSVCDGVSHAHRKSIIHRDLKPSNVLVTEVDGRPVAKIIDFGVAKAIAAEEDEGTLLTHAGVLIGTLEYMSPEQADPGAGGVDTRTDVYALGVILYELLVGALPLDPKELRAAGRDGIYSRIRTAEPVRPSTRISTHGEAQTSAAARRADPGSLKRLLQGDLDWITMKALEKDPTRRYDSPSSLREDIQRHLTYQPVEAGPPSASYRFRKFVRRNRVGVTTAAVIGLGLLAAGAGVGVGLVRALRAEERASAEAERAGREAATSRQVVDFLVELFEVQDPGEARGETITAREVLDRGAEKIRTDLGEQPLVQARLMRTMGFVYHNLGLLDVGAGLVGEALQLHEGHSAPGDEEWILSLTAAADIAAGQGDYQKARETVEEAIRRNTEARGEEHPMTLQLRGQRARILTTLGDHEEARAEYDVLLPLFERVHGPVDDRLVVLWSNYGVLLYRAFQDQDGAAEAFRNALGILRKIPDQAEGQRMAQLLINTGSLEVGRGNLDEAARLIEEALPLVDRIFGREHRESLGAWMNFAVIKYRQGDLEAAGPAYEEVLGRAEAVLGPDHPQVSSILHNKAVYHLDVDEAAGAKPLLERALVIRRRTFGPDHPEVASSLVQLALADAALGDPDAARESWEEALRINDVALPPGHTDRIADLEAYAEFLESLGEDASELRERARALWAELDTEG